MNKEGRTRSPVLPSFPPLLARPARLSPTGACGQRQSKRGVRCGSKAPSGCGAHCDQARLILRYGAQDCIAKDKNHARQVPAERKLHQVSTHPAMRAFMRADGCTRASGHAAVLGGHGGLLAVRRMKAQAVHVCAQLGAPGRKPLGIATAMRELHE